MSGFEMEIGSVSLAGLPSRTRLPFRFGMVTLTEAPVLAVRIVARVGSEDFVGYAADLAVPKWFEKNADKTSDQDVLALMASARRAAAALGGMVGSAFECWQRIYRECVLGENRSGVALVDGFGVALVERALIDAACRATETSFREALESGVLGFGSGQILEETAGLGVDDILVSEAPDRVLLRHTVGGLDPLRSTEVTPEQRGSDDHPVALEEDIARHGLRAFKLKVGAGPEADVNRLFEVSRVVAEAGVERPIFTLDGNEQYPDLGQLGRLLDRLGEQAEGQWILEGLQYIEQPLPRHLTFDPSTAESVRAIAQQFPLLIDEADHGTTSFSDALDLGYLGVSVKNCKGVFRALANRALCIVRGGGAFQTSEDLTNLPVLSLQQDLTTLAALGLPHTERNGHHFFPGLDVLPEAEAESALACHPDLYGRVGDRIVLKIEEGALSLACQHAKGYGYGSEIDWTSRLSFESIEAGFVR
jgi:hypothetical protein